MAARSLAAPVSRLVLCSALLVSTGCLTLYDHGVNRSLGYRSPIGIRVEINRYGTPITSEHLAQLTPGTSNLGEALAVLGAPHRLRRSAAEEALEYYYVYDRKTRLVVKPLFFVNYGEMASYDYRGSERGTDVVALVFDHGGRLLRKEFRNSAPNRSTGAMLKNVFVP